MIRRSGCAALAGTLIVLASPAWADFRLDRRLPLAPGGALTLKTDTGSVTLIGDSRSGVTVVVTGRRDDLDQRMDFMFEAQAGSVRITGTQRRPWVNDWWREWHSQDNVHFEVHVPLRSGVTVQTSGGAVRVSGLEGGARIKTSGGSLRVDRVTGNVEARTSGGPIRVTDSGGDVSASTSGGGIQVQGAGGRVDAHTSGGPISVEFAPGNNRGGALSTSGGGVVARVDPAAALSIDARTSGGGITSDLTVTTHGVIGRNILKADLNGGGALLQVRTSGGPVRIAQR